MLRDERRPLEFKQFDKAILHHVEDVTADAMLLPWNTVRRFSQLLINEIEKGRMAWDNWPAIEAMRTRTLALGDTGVKAQSTRSSQNVRPTGQRERDTRQRELICKHYNTQAGCRNQWDHTEGDVRLMHGCSFCYCTSARAYAGHNILNCDKLRAEKMAMTQRDAAGSRGRQSSSHYSSRGSKNSSAAPQRFQ